MFQEIFRDLPKLNFLPVLWTLGACSHLLFINIVEASAIVRFLPSSPAPSDLCACFLDLTKGK